MSETTTTDAAVGSFDYLLPSLGADMDEGRVVEWRVAIGDNVHRGDLMAVVETEKSDIDIEIWHDGTVDAFLVPIGELIEVGTPIVRMRGSIAGSEPVVTPPTTTPAPATAQTPEPLRLRAPVPPPARIGDRVLASPLARRLGAERGLDLTAIAGTGPGGAVVEADLRTVKPVEPAEPARRRTPATMRSLIAERMSRSNREIPHYHLARDVDVGRLEAWLVERNTSRPITERLLPAACYIRAVALAAARHGEFNGSWVDDHFEPADSVNVAMAISLRGGGLVTPHVEAADQRSLDEIMATLNELVSAARSGNLRASWMTGSTITITNLGDTGADLVHGVISPPQVALVGFGRSRQRPWVVDDLVTIRPVVTTTLAADHRATDGANGSRFLATIATQLEHPEDL
ncbi:MAG TPA: dihydrolipoamide acetyltransferase family protein [Ilumatobacteraceae bacterium]|nr:dihydrolipoamide acetyltransferase family protein [Ilumatobacteraceae bacterium]